MRPLRFFQRSVRDFTNCGFLGDCELNALA